LAYVYYQRNELNNAAYWFEKIVSTKSSNSSDYESLLDIYTKLNKLNECYLLASKGSELGYTDCINVLAYCYAFGNGTKQNFKLAIKTIDKAIQLAPDNMNYLDSKGEILLMNKKTNDARKIWEQINQTVHGYYADKTTVLNDYFMNSSN
jgi:TPR repeat protein